MLVYVVSSDVMSFDDISLQASKSLLSSFLPNPPTPAPPSPSPHQLLIKKKKLSSFHVGCSFLHNHLEESIVRPPPPLYNESLHHPSKFCFLLLLFVLFSFLFFTLFFFFISLQTWSVGRIFFSLNIPCIWLWTCCFRLHRPTVFDFHFWEGEKTWPWTGWRSSISQNVAEVNTSGFIPWLPSLGDITVDLPL